MTISGELMQIPPHRCNKEIGRPDGVEIGRR